ncbi:sigma-70 factor domain-containing protein [Nostoc flagelliforme]|uniref:sigma-70 factor domain-containing protein n=1 Tax=Nostoc flagelliforme TaxID=1306274 RepID=UPI001F55933C|nr:sigma-70 factor domain-containing protein [Nostoc flagelliforme]
MPSQTTDLVRSYLKEIGRYPLLTPEQEITNARLVQQMMTIEEQRASLALQLNREPTTRELATSLGQTEAEVQSIVQQGQKAKHRMVTANLRLVVAIAKKYQNHNLDFLDLLQEGALGLQNRANASKVLLILTKIKTQRKISISGLIYFPRLKAIAKIFINK